MKITLCGSLRFEDLFHEWNEKLTLAGHTVYSVAVYPSYKKGNKDWYTEEQKTILDLIHLSKISNSDCIFVLNKDKYIGSSTRKEIMWAKMIRKEIVYLEGSKIITPNYLLENHGFNEV